MRHHRTLLILTLGLVTSAVACGGGGSSGGTTPPPADANDLAAKLEVLHGARILFGHNSVGQNIVGGLGDLLAAQTGPKPVVLESDAPGDMAPGVFAHRGIGGNGYPFQKVATFQNLVVGPLGGHLDVALMKFCFVDFQTDAWDNANYVDNLLAAYDDMVSAARDAHPGLKIVHVTVPLSPTDEVNNARRERISQRLRAAYGADVFDLARVESTDPITHQRISGTHGPRLYEGWKADGSGHLNAAGSQAVARALVAFLAQELQR